MQNQMINFSIPRPLLETVDDLAQAELKTRSELIRDAVREYLGRRLILKKRWEAIFAYGQKKAKSLGIRLADVEDLVEEYRQGK